MITKIYEFYKLLTEKAFNIDDTRNQVLLRSVSKNEVKLCLYNHAYETITGYITADNASKDTFFTIDRISADKGWGPFMYSLMLQSLYPMGVKPSRLIRPIPLRIWKSFMSNPNITNKMLSANDKNYITELVPSPGFDDVFDDGDVEVINTVFYMHPQEWFVPFITESDEIIIEKKIDVKKVFKQCLDFFHDKYYSTTESAEIPVKDVTDKYLLVDEKGASIQLMIQDANKIYGYAELLKKPTYYQVINVAAEKGWGPFLYDTVMSYLDMPIRPNRSVTREALGVWNKYLKQRDDVKKTPVKTDVWDSIDLDQKLDTKSSLVEPLNYTYTITDDGRKTEAIDWQYDSTTNFVNPMKAIVSDFIAKRFNQGKMYFNKRYPLGI